MDKLTKDFMKLEGGLVVILALLVLLACCMTSCKSIEYMPVIEHKTDTVIQTKVQKDSLFLHDSVYVKEKGDSVLIERWHTKYITRERHDTTYISKTDTVPQPYPVTKYVEKQLSKPQKGLMTLGILSLMALVIFLAIKIKRFLPF